MSEITITINGRHYDVSCDQGQEGRVLDLATYVDHRVKEIAKAGSAYNDSHLMVLTSLVLANETLEERGNISIASEDAVGKSNLDQRIIDAEKELLRLEKEKEKALSVISGLMERVESLTTKVNGL